MKQYSAYAQLLPFLEQGVLFGAANFMVAAQDLYLFDGGNGKRGIEANATVMASRLGFMVCPSDTGWGNPGWTAGTNYRVNLGTDRWSFTGSSPTGGPLGSYFNQGSGATTDGLSNTVAFCEKLRGRVGATQVDARTDMLVGGLGAPATADESLANCRANLNAASPFYSTGGLTWFIGTLSQTCYNHIITPNGTTPDCILPLSNPVNGLIGARSNHPGGVFASMADGSVRFVSGSIRPGIWRAIGTRGSGEVLSHGDF